MLRRAYYKAYFPVDSGTPPLGLRVGSADLHRSKQGYRSQGCPIGYFSFLAFSAIRSAVKSIVCQSAMREIGQLRGDKVNQNIPNSIRFAYLMMLGLWIKQEIDTAVKAIITCWEACCSALCLGDIFMAVSRGSGWRKVP